MDQARRRLCLLVSLRDALRRREVFVDGAAKWRDPEEDLPQDFDTTRELHYEALRKPLDPSKFVFDLQTRLTRSLEQLDNGLLAGTIGGVKITKRRGSPWITVPKLAKLDEPANLGKLKDEVLARWGTLDLLEVLKEADFLTGFTEQFVPIASREVLDRETLRRRLLLCLFGLGTNMGIKAITDAGGHGETERELRHVRRTFITKDNLRRAIVKVVNATFEAGNPTWWGDGNAYASDSKKFGSWESNLMTEWHNRYGGPGVMIYWHVEKKSTCIYSQLKNCSSSEVAAMTEGVLRHDTDAEIEGNYVDTHGASIVGFAFTELLGFKLLPRLKNIGSIRLYRASNEEAYGEINPVLSRPVNWDLIAQQYDQMVKQRQGHDQPRRTLAQQGRTKQAKKLFRRAADLGNAKGMTSLGALLAQQGRTKQAKKLFRRAADLGNAKGMTSLGALLEKRGRTKQAEALYRQAADLGNAKGMTSLASLLARSAQITAAGAALSHEADFPGNAMRQIDDGNDEGGAGFGLTGVADNNRDERVLRHASPAHK